jgi:hypothetical protein
MVRQGSDLVLVAELAGHRRLETTRRYSLPSDADRLLAVERLLDHARIRCDRPDGMPRLSRVRSG